MPDTMTLQDETDIFGELDAMLDSLEAAKPAEEPKERYTILGLGDEEAQGRGAARHLRRIAQVKALAATRVGGLKETIEGLESELLRAKTALGGIKAWIAKHSAFDQIAILEWVTTAPQFTDPKAPREKHLDLGAGVVGMETKTKAQQVTASDEIVLAALFPEFVDNKPKLRWGDLKKERLEVRGRDVVDKVTGEVLPDGVVTVTPKHSEERYYIILSGERQDLTGEAYDGSGDEFGDGDADDADGADPA